MPKRGSWPEWLPADFVAPDRVRFEFDGYWLNILGEEPPVGITGKYLFFHEDPLGLVRIAITEIAEHGFRRAKVNSTLVSGPEHVLCLYDLDGSRGRELRDRNAERYHVKYRWWKADADTYAGRYSEEFLTDLDPAQRRAYERSHPHRER